MFVNVMPTIKTFGIHPPVRGESIVLSCRRSRRPVFVRPEEEIRMFVNVMA
jgi:hypothetical protein